MKPTVGRIVHYRRGVDDPSMGQPEILPAIITQVWNATCVNLQVFLEGAVGTLMFRTSVLQGDEPRQWNWPEIQ